MLNLCLLQATAQDLQAHKERWGGGGGRGEEREMSNIAPYNEREREREREGGRKVGLMTTLSLLIIIVCFDVGCFNLITKCTCLRLIWGGRLPIRA